MSDPPRKNDSEYREQRIAHLERVNRETLQALAMVEELDDLKTPINRIDDIATVFAKADGRIRTLIDFRSTAFYTFDDNGTDLDPAYAGEGARPGDMDRAFHCLVDNLHVAKCINSNKTVFATCRGDTAHYLLHPLATSSRVRGLFIGALAQEKQYIPDSYLSVFTVIMGRTATLLESFELYGMINATNTELKLRIDELGRKQGELEEEITRRMESESELIQSRQMLQMIMENIPQHVFWKDADCVYMGCNRNFAEAAGLPSPEAIVGKTDHDLPWHPEEAEFFRRTDRQVMRNNQPVLSLVEQITTRNDGERFIETNKVPLLDETSDVIGVLGTFHDITEQKAHEEELAHQAYHDSLTGLPNRALIIERIDRAIRRAKRNPDDAFAVILMDLDRFKYVNDSLGHLSGDRMLVELGGRLAETLRETDTVARLGGDEFALLIEGFRSPKEVVTVLRRVVREVQRPFEVHGNTLHSTASIGVVLDTRDYTSPDDILRDADVAMYNAKSKGGGLFKMYTHGMRDTVLKTATLQNDLITGLEKDEFRLHYQPIFDTYDNTLQGVEALVRWEHPVRGTLAPDEFIPIAEDTGLIEQLGRHLLDLACSHAARWQTLTGTPFYVSVNISARQLRSPRFAATVQECLDNAGLDGNSIALEMTETALMDQANTSLSILQQLKGLGIRLFLDDFGTGYSSLSYLQQFPVDTIKIDKFFIKSLNNGGSGQEIVKAVMALARSLGMKVIAEGVEDRRQLEALEFLHCHMVQGFLLGKPLPPESIDRLL